MGNVELVDVPTEGEHIVLFRVKELPAYAFPMWVSHRSSTAAWMAFRLGDRDSTRAYPIVCACCPSEEYGLTAPKGDDEREEWLKGKAAQFKKSLVDACRANGITTLFMRRAAEWKPHYGDTEGLQIVEAKGFSSTLLEEHGRRVVRESFQFLTDNSTVW
jgi:hypothetical protein